MCGCYRPFKTVEDAGPYRFVRTRCENRSFFAIFPSVVLPKPPPPTKKQKPFPRGVPKKRHTPWERFLEGVRFGEGEPSLRKKVSPLQTSLLPRTFKKGYRSALERYPFFEVVCSGAVGFFYLVRLRARMVCVGEREAECLPYKRF